MRTPEAMTGGEHPSPGEGRFYQATVRLLTGVR